MTQLVLSTATQMKRNLTKIPQSSSTSFTQMGHFSATLTAWEQSIFIQMEDTRSHLVTTSIYVSPRQAFEPNCLPASFLVISKFVQFVACDHYMGMIYYIMTITNLTQFPSYKCKNQVSCNDSTVAYMGYGVSTR